MCRNPLRLATALVLILGLTTAAPPAFALFGKAKDEKKAEAKLAVAPAPAPPPRKATPEQRATADRLDALGRAAFWAREAQVDPTDIEAGLKLSRALRALGRYDEAMQAADLVLVGAPTNLEVQLEAARAKIAAGQGFYAIEVLQKARQAQPRDWRPVSLLGVALEQSQRPEEARQAFEQALKISPDHPAVLSNYALFHAARGEVPQAEAMLRTAIAQPGAGAQERQNLALVLGLQGKYAEAEQLMRRDLPPEVANANLAYLQANPGRAPGSAAGPGSSIRSWSDLQGAQAAPAGRTN